MPESDATTPAPNASSGGEESRPADPTLAGLTDSQIEAALTPADTHSSRTTSSRRWQPPSVEELQRLLPQYEVQQFIARGGMGAVYKGWQKSLDRFVAIKILPPDIDDQDVRYAERFKLEAKAMAKLKHPGIVSVHDAGETPDGLLYFIMEFVEGTDVAQLVTAQGKLPVERALAITRHVCDALAYAHGKGIVHRDVKPSNIMLEADGTVKVADFGLAKTITQDSGGFTRSDISLGTPDFIAPEALMAGIKVDARADLYAVGVMLYQMITGIIPRGRFKLPSGVVPNIDPRLDAIVDKAMQTDREHRYSTALELKADIEKAVEISRSQQALNTAKATAAASHPSHGLKPTTTLLAAAAVVLAVAAIVFFASNRKAPTEARATKSTTTAVSTQSPNVIKLWDTQQKAPKEKAVHWEDGAVVLGDDQDKGMLNWAQPRSRDAIIRADIRTNPDMEYASIRLRYNWTEGQGDLYRLELHNGIVNLSVLVRGQPKDLQAWHLPRAYGPDEWVRLELKAIGDELTASLDGKVLGSVRDSTLTGPGSIMIVGRKNAHFRNIEYVSLDKTTAASPSQPAGNVIDLLALVDVKRDAIEGEWSHTTDGLAVKRSTDASHGHSRLQLPYTPPAQYDFEIEFTPADGAGDVRQILSARGRSFKWVMDAGLQIGRKAGFDMLDGKGVQDNEEASVMRQQFLSNGKRHIARVEVRQDLLRGFIDGEELVRWRGDFNRLEINATSAMRDAQHLGLFAYDREVTFHKITVREVSGTGTLDTASATTKPGDSSGWTNWTVVDLKNRGWIADGDGFTTDKPIRGWNILPGDTQDAAVRVTYLLRDASGVQITARDRTTNGQLEKYVAEDDVGELKLGRMQPDGRVKYLKRTPYPFGITREGEHTLEFRIVGDTLTAALNGEVTASVQDATLGQGPWALVLKKGALVKKLETQTKKVTTTTTSQTSGNVIDLLGLVDTKRDSINGAWSVTPEGAVRSLRERKAGRLEFPYSPPAEYDFEIEFTVAEGDSGYVMQVFAVPGHWLDWRLLPPPAFGPSLDGVEPGNAPRTEGIGQLFRLKLGDRHRSLVEVRANSLRALVDGKEIARYTGDFKRLSDPVGVFKLRDTTHVGVGVLDIGLLIHKATVREVSGVDTQARVQLRSR